MRPRPASVGDLITYTFVIHNTGDVALTRVSASDTLLGDLAADFPAALAPRRIGNDHQDARDCRRAIQSPLPNTVTTVYQVVGLSALNHAQASCPS